MTGDENLCERFFEDDNVNRIHVLHPDSRYGAEARPTLLADDFLQLNDLLVPYLRFLATGVYRA